MIRRHFYSTLKAAKLFAAAYAKEDQYPWHIWVVGNGYMIKPAHEVYTSYKKIATANSDGKVFNQ